MKIYRSLAAIVLIAAPSLSLAQGCHGDAPKISASNCEVGTEWSETLHACLPITNS